MGIRDEAARNKSLDNDYGATHGANAPAAFQVALFTGDPMQDGVEIAAETDIEGVMTPNGYERVIIPNDGTIWAAASGGVKSTLGVVQFPDALEEYPDSVTHWALYDDVDGSTMWDTGELVEPYDQTGAGTGPNPVLSIFYDYSEGVL